MNKLEMMTAIKQMLEEMERKPESIQIDEQTGTITITWTVEWKPKTYTIKIERISE